jgi:rhamnose transport system substrate-binding protein
MNRMTLTIVVLGLVAAGCEKRAAPDAKTSAASDGEADRKVRVVYIPKNTGNPYFNGIVEGFRKACDELGAEFRTIAPATPEATSQIPFVKDLIQQRVDVICISPNSPDALNATFDDARARGIRVIVVNSDIPGSESHRDAAVLPTDFERLGAEQIELLGSLISYEGRFAILSATTDAPDQNYWIAGMKEALKDPKYAKMELVEIVYGNDEPEKSRIEAEGLLIKHPQLRAILAPTAVGVEQAAKTVEAAGVYPGGPQARGPGIVVTGLGTPNQMRRYIKEGIIPAVALWSPPDQGHLAGHLAVAMARGELKPVSGQSFEVPGLGTRQFREHAVVITGPPIIFTRENIDAHRF